MEWKEDQGRRAGKREQRCISYTSKRDRSAMQTVFWVSMSMYLFDKSFFASAVKIAGLGHMLL